MKRLSHQIYLTIILCLVAVVMVAGFFWSRSGGSMHTRQAFAVAGELAAAALPASTQSQQTQSAALKVFAKRLDIDLALFSSKFDLIASTTTKQMPTPPHGRHHGGFMFKKGGPAWSIALPDGRWLVARITRNKPHRPGLRLIILLSSIALVIGLLAWPVVRGLTRRLEHLQNGIEKLKSGDLSSRVKIEGRDEIARLAKSFNDAAERIEELVKSHKMLLANASHELRTPLSRIRLGIDLLAKQPNQARSDAIALDIKELDDLIEEILLLSRLDARLELDEKETIDLLALAAEEASNYKQCETEGTPVMVNGSTRLLRRMIRNLLENATKHASPPIHVKVVKSGTMAKLQICDNGPGISPKHMKDIFEPFHRGDTSSTTAGTGLGLALVRQIAERHGGTVQVIDNPKDGRLNCFEIKIPTHTT